MRTQEAKKLANELMDKWNLTPKWSFKFDKAKRRFGCCKPGRRQITLSRALTKRNDIEDVKDTILHEIAHALDFEDRGKSDHSEHWKRWARKVGASDERCYDGEKVNNVEYSYYYYCPNCEYKGGRHRRNNKASLYGCPKCGGRSFNTDNLVIPNIPAAKMEEIEKGNLNWQETKQAKRVINILADSRHDINDSKFYANYMKGKKFTAVTPEIESVEIKPAARTSKPKKKKKRRGVIATIVETIKQSGDKGVTKDEILEVLVEAFPNREASGMRNTINAQVPYRINKNKMELEQVGDRYRKA